MITVTPELVDAHRRDLLAAASDHRRNRLDGDAPRRRSLRRWAADLAA